MEQPGTGIKEAEVIHLLKDCVVLVTNKGGKLPSKEVIHFSSAFLPSPNLEQLFPGMQMSCGAVIFTVYLMIQLCIEKNSIVLWYNIISNFQLCAIFVV